MSCTLEPATQSGDIGQRMSLFDSCLYDHRDVHYCICLGNLASNSQSLQENSQSERAYYCSHAKNEQRLFLKKCTLNTHKFFPVCRSDAEIDNSTTTRQI